MIGASVLVTKRRTDSESTFAFFFPVAAAAPVPAAVPAPAPMAAPFPPPAAAPMIAPNTAPPPILEALLPVCDPPVMVYGPTVRFADLEPERMLLMERTSSPE